MVIEGSERVSSGSFASGNTVDARAFTPSTNLVILGVDFVTYGTHPTTNLNPPNIRVGIAQGLTTGHTPTPSDPSGGIGGSAGWLNVGGTPCYTDFAASNVLADTRYLVTLPGSGWVLNSGTTYYLVIMHLASEGTPNTKLREGGTGTVAQNISATGTSLGAGGNSLAYGSWVAASVGTNNWADFSIYGSITYLVDSFLKKITLQTYSMDAELEKAGTKTYSVDCKLLGLKNYMTDSILFTGTALPNINIINFEVYSGNPSWHIIDPNTLYLSSGGINNLITPITFQSGTHIGLNGIDKCGANHVPNVKIISANTMSINGAAAVALSDVNLIGGGDGTVLSGDFRYSTFRIHFQSSKMVSLKNGKLYIYNIISELAPGQNVDIAAYVVSNGQVNWQTINSYSNIGADMAFMNFTVNNIGGSINEYIDLLPRGPAMDHYYNVVLSASPENPGIKNVALGVYLEYF